MTQANGTFQSKITQQPADEETDANISKLLIDRQFHGDLEATSQGQMLALGTGKWSAGYVALERVSGKLHGLEGTFALQHTGTMTRGALQWTQTVVPDSGSRQLAGLSGTMANIADGKHSYQFHYTLPEVP